jgi:beta-lactamase regulating signal transducer with metallopeptidase domain
MNPILDLGAANDTGTLLLVVKATVLLAAALGVTAIMRRASAGSRHLVLVATFASLLVLPLLAARLPIRLRILPQSLQTSELVTSANVAPITRADEGTRSTAGARGANITDATPAASAGGGAIESAQPERDLDLAARGAAPNEPTRSRWSTGLILALVWGGGVIVFLAWLLHGQLTVRRIVKQAPPMNSDEWRRALWEVADRLDLDQVPLLLQSDRTHMPFASGFLKPVIVLPADAESWSADRRAAVLLHELAHVRRKDLFGHTLGRVACAVYWFHPLVWAAAKRLRVESERACDDFAITCGARASDYAEHLLDIVTAVRKQMTPAVAMAMAHRKEF